LVAKVLDRCDTWITEQATSNGKGNGHSRNNVAVAVDRFRFAVVGNYR